MKTLFARNAVLQIILINVLFLLPFTINVLHHARLILQQIMAVFKSVKHVLKSVSPNLLLIVLVALRIVANKLTT